MTLAVADQGVRAAQRSDLLWVPCSDRTMISGRHNVFGDLSHQFHRVLGYARNHVVDFPVQLDRVDALFVWINWRTPASLKEGQTGVADRSEIPRGALSTDS